MKATSTRNRRSCATPAAAPVVRPPSTPRGSYELDGIPYGQRTSLCRALVAKHPTESHDFIQKILVKDYNFQPNQARTALRSVRKTNSSPSFKKHDAASRHSSSPESASIGGQKSPECPNDPLESQPEPELPVQPRFDPLATSPEPNETEAPPPGPCHCCSGSLAKEANQPSRQLTKVEVAEVISKRKKLGLSCLSLATLYGVSHATIGTLFKDVKGKVKARKSDVGGSMANGESWRYAYKHEKYRLPKSVKRWMVDAAEGILKAHAVGRPKTLEALQQDLSADVTTVQKLLGDFGIPISMMANPDESGRGAENETAALNGENVGDCDGSETQEVNTDDRTETREVGENQEGHTGDLDEMIKDDLSNKYGLVNGERANDDVNNYKANNDMVANDVTLVKDMIVSESADAINEDVTSVPIAEEAKTGFGAQNVIEEERDEDEVMEVESSPMSHEPLVHSAVEEDEDAVVVGRDGGGGPPEEGGGVICLDLDSSGGGDNKENAAAAAEGRVIQHFPPGYYEAAYLNLDSNDTSNIKDAINESVDTKDKSMLVANKQVSDNSNSKMPGIAKNVRIPADVYLEKMDGSRVQVDNLIFSTEGVYATRFLSRELVYYHPRPEMEELAATNDNIICSCQSVNRQFSCGI